MNDYIQNNISQDISKVQNVLHHINEENGKDIENGSNMIEMARTSISTSLSYLRNNLRQSISRGGRGEDQRVGGHDHADGTNVISSNLHGSDINKSDDGNLTESFSNHNPIASNIMSDDII
eukprot:CAMPEP_0114347716 /NCGR_PEP_ID=MMETSP0101-20121206/14133_1 /TAXON_ID=38822 ORGANISM="Pteridomonas danica, Strain PT" /NCGR_SAMPLE_ID=MMETSP0101 /ASSEMBLY_ACC=CAM_ASM_000211 /LENGTH=120 /DNA_ID=CAMNT_0001485213 /DNA_START=96 /DNA_END=458 /DNA_ORIENTATION=+